MVAAVILTKEMQVITATPASLLVLSVQGQNGFGVVRFRHQNHSVMDRITSCFGFG